MPPDISHGAEFEIRFAQDMGLEPVPGSGSQWHSKLDNSGRGTRWSLKSTIHEGFRVTRELLEEIELVVSGPGGGTGELGFLAVELGARGRDPVVFVAMSPGTFKALATEELTIARESKAEAKRRGAAVPQLLREES